MKHFPLFLLLLLAFRICVVPVGYARFAHELAHGKVTFEQIRVKNRRSSYHEEGAVTSEIHTPASAAFISIRRLLVTAKKRLVCSVPLATPLFKDHLSLPLIARCLYLLNRAFRI